MAPNGIEGLKVLIVDDDDDCRGFIATVLLEEKAAVTEVATAEEAVRVLQERRFDIHLLDKNLPDMDGISLARHIRDREIETPVIMITGQATVETAVQAMRFGVDDYLVKPIDNIDLLFKTMMGALDHRRLKEENKRLQQTLAHSKRMASVGFLAAGVAHEINNPLGFLVGNLELLKLDMAEVVAADRRIRDVCDGLRLDTGVTAESVAKTIDKVREETRLAAVSEEARGMINECLDGAHRVKRIVEGLRCFSHPGKPVDEAFDINAEIDKSLSLVWCELRYKCEVVKDLKEVPLLRGNPGQIDQVLVNILVNAAQAIEHPNGRITIATHADNGRVVVEIADNGSGISKENLEHIFDPFFTTKDVGGGTGLSLSIAYGIIKAHGGDVGVRSSLGEGTTVTIGLPQNRDTEEKT